MRNNEANKCKICGATLVGKKKGQVCPNCKRKVGQGAATGVGAAGVAFGIYEGVKKIVKIIIKKA